MRIINQWKDDSVRLKEIEYFNVYKILNMTVTQTSRVNERDIGKYLLVAVLKKKIKFNGLEAEIEYELGKYSTKRKAEEALGQLNFANLIRKKTFEMAKVISL